MSRHELEPPKFCKTCGEQLEATLEAVFEHWRNNTPCWHAVLGRLETADTSQTVGGME